MKTYENISSVKLANPIQWGPNQATTIATYPVLGTPAAEITVDAEAEIVTVVDPKTRRTLFIPFDNVVCMEQAPKPAVDPTSPPKIAVSAPVATPAPASVKKK